MSEQTRHVLDVPPIVISHNGLAAFSRCEGIRKPHTVASTHSAFNAGLYRARDERDRRNMAHLHLS
jgi:hypothetical protein